MNIALFTDTYPPEINGVATSTANLRRTLMDHGHNVLVVATNPFSDKITYEDGVIRVPGIMLKKLYGYLFAPIYPRVAMKYIAAFRPDIIHIQTDLGLGMFGMLAARKLRVGSIYTFHTMIEDYAYYVTKGFFDRFARHAVRLFYRVKSNAYSEIIAPSEKIKDYLRSIGVDCPLPVIPTGIEFSRFDPAKENPARTAELQKKFGIKPSDKVILSLGRVAKEKSIDVLLRGYAKLLQEGISTPTKFVIVGFGPAEAELKALVKELGIENNVIFTGKCDPSEVQDYYHLGHIFASASLTETQGLTYMEGMAARLLVLARYDDNLVGTIKDNETGFFFFSEDDFAQKVRLALSLPEDERKRIEDNALQAIDIYSMERFYQNIIEVYTRVRKKNW